MILYGHTHFGMYKQIDNVVYSSPFSVGFAFSPELPKFEIAHGLEGFNVLVFSQDSIFIKTIRI